MFRLARVTFFVSAAATALGALAGVAVSSAYHPGDATRGWLSLAVFLALLAALAALVVRRPTQGLWRYGVIATLSVSGVFFAAFGLIRTLGDPGDALIWMWPLLLGISLVVTSAEPGEAD